MHNDSTTSEPTLQEFIVASVVSEKNISDTNLSPCQSASESAFQISIHDNSPLSGVLFGMIVTQRNKKLI